MKRHGIVVDSVKNSSGSLISMGSSTYSDSLGSIPSAGVRSKWGGSSNFSYDRSTGSCRWSCHSSQKRDSCSSEFKTSLVDTRDSQIAQRTSGARALIKLAKLRLENVGFYGRDEHVAQIQACIDRLVASVRSKETPSKTELVLISGPSGKGPGLLCLV